MGGAPCLQGVKQGLWCCSVRCHTKAVKTLELFTAEILVSQQSHLHQISLRLLVENIKQSLLLQLQKFYVFG